MEPAPWDSIPAAIEREARAVGIARAAMPPQRAVSLAEGVVWARSMASEGFDVGYVVDTAAGVVWIKVWEYPDPEPSWASVLASARPSLRFDFQTSEAARVYCELIVDSIAARHGYSEQAAHALVNQHHDRLPWLTKPTIDPMRDDFPEVWAHRLVSAATDTSNGPAGDGRGWTWLRRNRQQ